MIKHLVAESLYDRSYPTSHKCIFTIFSTTPRPCINRANLLYYSIFDGMNLPDKFNSFRQIKNKEFFIENVQAISIDISYIMPSSSFARPYSIQQNRFYLLSPEVKLNSFF